MTPRAIVVDVEGTVTPIAFVREALFPYARRRLPAFVREHAHEPSIRKLLAAMREIAWSDVAPLAPGDDDPLAARAQGAPDVEEAIRTLLRWSDEDRKATPLKTLQGLIWTDGYARGELTAETFADALDYLRRWREAGIALYVYSSGSVAAQRMLFAHTVRGDLRALFAGNFDTAIGAKIESGSYRRIAEAIAVPGAAILLLSDHPAEIAAAEQAGWRGALMLRDGEPRVAAAPQGRVVFRDFAEVDRTCVNAPVGA